MHSTPWLLKLTRADSRTTHHPISAEDVVRRIAGDSAISIDLSSSSSDDPIASSRMIATAIYVATAAGLGGVAGLLGGLVGVGGGFLVIPLLGLFYGMDQQTAQGTVLIMVVPNVVWAFSQYRRLFGIDLRMAATIAGSALIATYPTARLATGLDPHVLRLAFAVFLATIAVI